MPKSSETLKLIFTEAKDRMLAGLNEIDSISTKFNFLFAFKGIVVASIFSSKIELIPAQKTGLFFLLVSILVDLYGFYIRNYRRDPDIEALSRKYKEKDPDYTRQRLIYNYIESIKSNSRKLKGVKFAFNFSLILTGLSFIFLSTQLFIKEITLFLGVYIK